MTFAVRISGLEAEGVSLLVTLERSRRLADFRHEQVDFNRVVCCSYAGGGFKTSRPYRLEAYTTAPAGAGCRFQIAEAAKAAPVTVRPDPGQVYRFGMTQSATELQTPPATKTP